MRVICFIYRTETWLLQHEIPCLADIDSQFAYTGKSAVDLSSGVLYGRPYGGVALLWRKGIFCSVSNIQCNNNRITAIKIRTADNDILIFSVYMPTNQLENLLEFCECLSEINAITNTENVEYVYMLGDFNAQPGELFGLEMENFCKDQKWVCADVVMLGRHSGTFTFISDAHGSRSWLDHCLVTEAAWLTVRDVMVRHDVYWSDHFPLEIICDLNIIRKIILNTTPSQYQNSVIWGERNNYQINKYSKLCNVSLRDIDFPKELSNCCDHVCSVKDHRLVIDKLYNMIINSLTDAAANSFEAERFGRGRHVLGWNKYVRDAHREARSYFNIWKQSGRPHFGTTFINMKNSRKIFKKKLKVCLNNHEQIKMNNLADQHKNKQFSKFWKLTNKLNQRTGLPASIDDNTLPGSIANCFKDNFIIQPRLSPQANLQVPPRVLGNPLGFSTKEVAYIIRRMSRGKSPGHDGLSIEHLQHAGPHLARVLAMFYTICIRHSYLPTQMMETVVVPVLKNKTGDISDKLNYRPISLGTILGKILDSLFERLLNKYVNINDAQFGFRAGLSTESAILALKQTVRYYTDRKTPVYAVFLDLSKAYDLVCYDRLWPKLYSLNVPSELINTLRFWYENQNNKVKWAGGFSEEFKLKCGVRQGGISSPLLFNLYMNQLSEELSSANVGCSIDGMFINNLSYADDMVLLAPSLSAVRKLVTICERYAAAHGLLYNVNKSVYMLFKGRNKLPIVLPTLSLNDKPLQRVTQVKYLGHVVTDDLLDDADMDRERRALSVRCNMLARRFSRCTDDVKITLFKAFCMSFYTCSLWVRYTRRAYNALRVQYNNAFRILLGLPRYCSASGMFMLANTDDFYTIMRKRAASMRSRTQVSPNSILNVLSVKYDSPFLAYWQSLHVRI